MAPGRAGLTRIDNPSEAVLAVGKENSELHEELVRVYAELDRYRNTITAISNVTGEPYSRQMALNALAQRRII